MLRQKLKLKFLEKNNLADYEIIPIPADASYRTYDRLIKNGHSFILMNCPPEHYRLEPFIDIAGLLKNHTLNAPDIHYIDSENGFMVLEDFGHISLKQYLIQNPHKQEEIYKEVINLLAQIQKIPARSLPVHTNENLIQGIEVFIDWYIPYKTGSEMHLKDKHSFIEKCHTIFDTLQLTKTFTLRDFHAENLMYVGGIIGLLDFQDATLSHPAYDLVSLLQDARYNVPNSLAKNMLNYYLSLHPKYDAQSFKEDYSTLGFQRNCRILGAFARKAARDNSPQYLELIPGVIKYLKSNKLSELLKDYI